MSAIPFPRMHVSLYVADLRATMNFYTIFFGTAPTKQKSGYAKYELVSPSLIISFVEDPKKVQAQFGHLGFQIETTEELHKRLEHAEQQNMVYKKELGVACCYAVQDKYWVSDPDGIKWEVYYFHSDVEFNDPHEETVPELVSVDNGETPCCISLESGKSCC